MLNLRYFLTTTSSPSSLLPPSRLQRPYAFTIVEIIIVVVILAIAALVAIPLAGSAAGVQMRSAANMIAADMEYARSLAISRGQNFSVVFDKNTESYRIEDQDGTVISHPVKKRFDYVVDFTKEPVLEAVEGEVFEGDLQRNRIAFVRKSTSWPKWLKKKRFAAL